MKLNKISTIIILVLLFLLPFYMISFSNDRIKWTMPLNGSTFNAQVDESSESVGDEWRMFGKYLNSTRVTFTDIDRAPDYFWRKGNDLVESASPVIADGFVYCASDFEMNCYNETTGVKIWDYSDQSPVVLSTPAVADKFLCFTHYDYIYCLDINGTYLWHKDIDLGYYGSPAIYNGRVYVGGRNISCLDISNGDVIWTNTTGSNINVVPTIVNGRLFVGCIDDNMYCFNLTTGNQIWNYTTKSSIKSTAAVANGRVFFGSNDYDVYCLNETTGDKLWNYSTDGMVTSSPAVANGRVYIGSYDDKVYCFNATDGTKLWNYTTNGNIRSSPSVANGYVYFGSYDEYVYCLNATGGELIWRYLTEREISSSPSIANGRVYIPTHGRGLYSLPMIFDYPPYLNLISPTNGSTIPKGQMLFFNISDNIELNRTWYSLDGGQATIFPSPYEINTSAWGPGLHVIQVNANDTYGLQTTKTYLFKLGAQTTLFEDVERGVNDWSTSGIPISNTTYGWHITTSDFYSPTHAWWCGNNLTGE